MLVNKIGHDETNQSDKTENFVNKNRGMKIQMGGFFLSDTREKQMYRRILNFNLKKQFEYKNINLLEQANSRNMNRPGGIQNNTNLFNETIKRLNSESYLKLHKFFIQEIFDKTRYTQKFSKTKGGKTILETSNLFPYVKNFMGIICLSFLLELELYTLVHYLITPNFFNKDYPNKIILGNTIPAIFQPYFAINKLGSNDATNPYRIYRKFLSGYNSDTKRIEHPPSIVDIVEEFTKRMDIIFNKFMNLLIQNLSYACNKSESEIKNILVVSEHYNHGKKRDSTGENAYIREEGIKGSDRVDEFDHIYVKWKDRLMKHMDGNLSRQQINSIIGNTLSSFENNKSKYIAEGTGFFSFIFLKYVDPQMSSEPDLYRDKVHNGSCITYSAIEAYILSRLHINGNHINLLLRNKIGEGGNNYWLYCQESLKDENYSGKTLGFSHWASNIKFKSGGNIRLRASKKDYQDLLEVNFVKNRGLFTKLLLYPILDSYKVYLRKMNGPITIEMNGPNGVQQKDIQIGEYVNKILNFIQARYNFIDQKINRKNRSYTSISMLSVKNSMVPKLKKKKIIRPKKESSTISTKTIVSTKNTVSKNTITKSNKKKKVKTKNRYPKKKSKQKLTKTKKKKYKGNNK
jgi:hypothetical protein